MGEGIELPTEFAAVEAGNVACHLDVVPSSHSVQSRLVMADGTLCFELVKPPPCAWWRFWQWALLGWRWVDLRESR